jgi:uncharacterized protein
MAASPETPLAPRIRQLLDGPSAGHLVTTGGDGAPVVDAVWVGRDGDRVLVATDRPPGTGAGPATLVVADPAAPADRAVLRGRLSPVAGGSEAALLDALAATYLGGSRPDAARPLTLLALAVTEARQERAELAVGPGPADPRANVAAVVGMLDALSRGDRVRAKAAFAPDATWQCPPSMPWPPFYEGRDAIFDQYFAVDEDLFETGVSEYDLEVFNTVAEGDQVAVEMRHRSAGLDGQPYESDHSLVYVVRDGLIVAVREYNDTLYLTRALLG